MGDMTEKQECGMASTWKRDGLDATASIHVSKMALVGYEFAKEGARKGGWFQNQARGESKRRGEAKEMGKEHVARKRTARGGFWVKISHTRGH
jgi:hypothetical protein